MGKFIYDGIVKVDFDDRVLAHLQMVIGAKVRRREAFYFSWRDEKSVGGGRTTVWIHPGSSIVYKYFGSKQPTINRAWIDALMFTANTLSGLHIVPEPPEPEGEPGGSEMSG